MSTNPKIKQTHLDRNAYVYVRQSTATQVQHNRESTRRQYQVVDRAIDLGWQKEFEKFAELGSARPVWLWFRGEGLSFPPQTIGLSEVRWVVPTYTTIHEILTNPVYAGAYT